MREDKARLKDVGNEVEIVGVESNCEGNFLKFDNYNYINSQKCKVKASVGGAKTRGRAVARAKSLAH